MSGNVTVIIRVEWRAWDYLRNARFGVMSRLLEAWLDESSVCQPDPRVGTARWFGQRKSEWVLFDGNVGCWLAVAY